MIDWLYAFPEPLLLILPAGLMVLLIRYLPRLTQRVALFRPTEPNLDFVTRMQAPLFTMTALVIAFTLVQAEANFRQVEAQVTAEASQINQLDRLLARFGSKQAAAARPLLRAYAGSIVRDEWPMMVKSGSSAKTASFFKPVSLAIMAIEPQPGRESLIYGEMLKSLEAIAASRDARLDNVQIGLPVIYWEVIGFAVLILLVISSTIEQTPYRSAVLMAQMSVLGVFIGFAFIMDQPFKGQTVVISEPIAHALVIMEKRDK